MKNFYNMADSKNQPCEPVWKKLYYVGKVEDDLVLFYVYYDPESDRILDFTDELEVKCK